ncbi:E3 ubiquitin-protein ligase siah-1-like isoform X2 [Pectinophora gossypiella]|nr:E3 ubiquitin-protein ligase siah-1-like isoform X2 [Pectinophora gossypiella]
MSNRKESLKKSLGITEYPWSSDDDETERSQAVPEFSVRRARNEQEMSNRGNGSDAPGTSAQPPPTSAPSQSSPRRSQLFWSLSLSNPHRMSAISVPRNSSRLEVPLSLVSRPSHSSEGRGERSSASTNRNNAALDVQRIFAFRRLNRNLNNYRASRSGSHLYAIPRSERRSSARNSRDSIYSTPSVALSNNVTALIKARSRRNLPRHSSQSARNVNPTLTEAVMVDTEEANRGIWRPLADPSLPISPGSLGGIESNVQTVNLDQSDELDELVLPDESSLTEPNNRNDTGMESETGEGGSHNVSGVSLEEEIVEIDVGTDPPPQPNENNIVARSDDHSPNEEHAVANTSSASDDAPQQQGVKRKRESDEDNIDPCTVKEFNQNLLRVLECPVCLEWMEPPMTQCRRGHLVCGRCRARLASCPVCRTAFSSVRNRAMESVAEMLRYPCRHGCGRDLRLRRRNTHEASCAARRYRCVAPACTDRAGIAFHELSHHFQNKHLSMVKIGRKHKFAMKVNSEQHDNWIIMALHQIFHLRVDVDIRTWGVVVYVAYLGPKCNANQYNYEVTLIGQHNSRKLMYTRTTHCDLECSSLNVSRQDCFHLTLDQALNFLRVKNRHCEPDKFLYFNVEITKNEVPEAREESDS